MKLFKTIVLAAVLALSSGIASAYQSVTPTKAFGMASSDPNVYILDVRTRHEWSFVGHPDFNDKRKDSAGLKGKVINIAFKVPNGIALEKNDFFIEDVKAFAKNKPNATFITMCRSGKRSTKAAEALEKAGVKVLDMKEGFEGGKDDLGHRTKNGWKLAGLPYVADFKGSYKRYIYKVDALGDIEYQSGGY